MKWGDAKLKITKKLKVFRIFWTFRHFLFLQENERNNFRKIVELGECRLLKKVREIALVLSFHDSLWPKIDVKFLFQLTPLTLPGQNPYLLTTHRNVDSQAPFSKQDSLHLDCSPLELSYLHADQTFAWFWDLAVSAISAWGSCPCAMPAHCRPTSSASTDQVVASNSCAVCVYFVDGQAASWIHWVFENFIESVLFAAVELLLTWVES